MGSTLKQFGALDPGGQQPRDGDASPGEKRSASGSGTGDWLVNVAGDVVVPMTTAEIVEGLRAAKLSERSLVWRLGMHDWILLGEVPQLRLAAGSATTVAAAPSSARVSHAPTEAQAESRRRRNTLPFGFPAARDSATVRQPSGMNLSSTKAAPVSVPRPDPRPQPAAAKASDDDGALAVYDRPAASLTFSDSVRAEWRGESRLVTENAPPSVAPAAARKLTPMPAVSSRLPDSARPFPNSLAPTTTDAQFAQQPRVHGPYADLSVVLASDFRAAKASSKRLALWGALGSALFASAITLWLVRTPDPALPTPSAAAQPVLSQPIAPPAAAPPLVELPAPSAVVAKPKAVAPRFPRAPTRARVKAVPRLQPAPVPSSETAVSDNPYPANEASEPRAPATSDGQATGDAPSATPSVESKPAPTPEPTAPAADPPTAP
ncbi:MAG: GYF domain-containing protein [Polyangiaceae bacterium]